MSKEFYNSWLHMTSYNFSHMTAIHMTFWRIGLWSHPLPSGNVTLPKSHQSHKISPDPKWHTPYLAHPKRCLQKESDTPKITPIPRDASRRKVTHTKSHPYQVMPQDSSNHTHPKRCPQKENVTRQITPIPKDASSRKLTLTKSHPYQVMPQDSPNHTHPKRCPQKESVTRQITPIPRDAPRRKVTLAK